MERANWASGDSIRGLYVSWRGSGIYVWGRQNWVDDRDGRWVSWYGFDEMDWEII
ncbi:hypothetical protein IE5_05548 [Bacillus cereus BAG3X2-2]|nr:hypothetical protein IE5_05548 [Bacillus cereus BAG3X2-2]